MSAKKHVLSGEERTKIIFRNKEQNPSFRKLVQSRREKGDKYNLVHSRKGQTPLKQREALHFTWDSVCQALHVKSWMDFYW